jgi:tRNA(Ile)-lysidine synthase
MAASRKLSNVDAAALAPLRGRRLAVALSGGVDSTVLLHVLHGLAPQLGYRLSAIHVNHRLSPNAGAWQRSCAAYCRELGVPLVSRKVSVVKSGAGLEAAARAARRKVFAALDVDAIALAHHQDDQAETVLFNLLRGAGLAGASGMAALGRLGKRKLVRPLLGVRRADILAYAKQHRLKWVEDESNASEALTRNFLRRSVGPLLEQKFPRWRESLARAARHFSARNVDSKALLRDFLASKGLRAPSEKNLVEMLKQLGSGGARVELKHDGAVLRRYRGEVRVEKLEVPVPGQLTFRKVKGRGIRPDVVKSLTVRRRSGGERLRLASNRPSRTLKNLFQEAGIPPWKRDGLPLLYSGDKLVWVPGLGVDAEFATSRGGVLPRWRPSSS